MINYIIERKALYMHNNNQKAPTILYIDKASFAELRKELHVGSGFNLEVTGDSLKFLGAEIMQVLPYKAGVRHVAFH